VNLITPNQNHEQKLTKIFKLKQVKFLTRTQGAAALAAAGAAPAAAGAAAHRAAAAATAEAPANGTSAADRASAYARAAAAAPRGNMQCLKIFSYLIHGDHQN